MILALNFALINVNIKMHEPDKYVFLLRKVQVVCLTQRAYTFLK